MSVRYKVMCDCEYWLSDKIIHSSLLTWCDSHLKQLKYRRHNAQNRRSGEISSCIFEMNNNTVRPHGCHIYITATDMDTATIFPCPYTHHGPLQWKCVLLCCDKCPIIVILMQAPNKDATNMCPKIHFYVYRNLSPCTVHGRRLYKERTTCPLCYTIPISDMNAKLYDDSTWEGRNTAAPLGPPDEWGAQVV